MNQRGFTLLEVMVSVALMSIVTAAAMAAFLLQSKATNTQVQVTGANDAAREIIRLISNDVRAAAAGVTPGAAGMGAMQGVASSPCDPGTIPFDISGGNIACLPPVFRSNTPLFKPTDVYGNPGTDFINNCGDTQHPGYQLNFGGGVTVPPTGAGGNLYFCPDDLIVLGVDDTNPLFMVQSAPGVSSVNNQTAISFAGTSTPARYPPGGAPSPTGAGYGFDDSSPNNYLPPLTTAASCLPYCEPLMLFGGATGAVLMNTAFVNGPLPYATAAHVSCATAECSAVAYGLAPSTASVNLIRNNLSFGAVAMPAHLYRYSIEPLDQQGNPSTCTAADPCTSADLVRSLIMPRTQNTILPNATIGYQTVSSTTLMKGVVDMQVEFGLQNPAPPVAGQSGSLVYVNSGGLQSAIWNPASGTGTQPTAASLANSIDNCLAGGATDLGVWSSVCFPTGGSNGSNSLTLLRTVRLNLTVRSGTNINTKAGTALTSSAAVGAVPLLQPAVQDLAPTGNIEAKQWGFSAARPFTPLPALDGATYRQVSTEIYIRNLGWTNNL